MPPSTTITLVGLVAEGRVAPASRVTDGALRFAIDVLGAYEPDLDESGEAEAAADLAAVIRFLEGEVSRRKVRVWVNALTREAKAQGLDVQSPRLRKLIQNKAEEKAKEGA